MTPDSELTRHLAGFRDRLVDGTLPFLLYNGWDHARGGLIERLRRDGSPDETVFRRAMVHARQLYVYSSWGARLGNQEYLDHADRIFEYMTETFWDREEGGWIGKVGLDGSILDADKDLYTHAFVLFGLGAYGRARGQDRVTPAIVDTMAVLRQRFLRSDGSFADRMSRSFDDISTDRRSQNPHMHLLEASLALTELTGAEASRVLAGDLIILFEQRFLHTPQGTVMEHLDAAFEAHPEDGHRIEPGHHFEWAWLLERASRILGQERCRNIAAAVLRSGLACGWDTRHGGIFDEIDRRDGHATLSTKRCWPVTELIKALVVLPDAAPDHTAGQAIELLLDRYLGPDGRWTERFNADWSVADATMPSSTAYHMSMALEEAERVLGGEGSQTAV